MSSAYPKKEVWDKVMSRYKELIEEHGLTYFAPFLSVLEQLAQSEYGKILHPTIAMHTFVIASTPHYPERLHKPFIVLAPKKDDVEVTLGPSLEDYDRRFSFSYDTVFEEIQPLLLSLLGYTSVHES